MSSGRATLAVTLATPLGLFCIVAWLDWRATVDIAWRDLVRTDEVALEHATKVFDSERLVAERVGDLMTRLDRVLPAAGAPARWPDGGGARPLDPALTQTLDRMIEALPQVSVTLLTDASGRVVAGSQPLPPGRSGQPPLSLAGRPSFQAVRAGAALAVSRTHVGLVLRQPVFGLVLRREAGHAFAGAIAVGSSPAFFETFWQTLIGEPASESPDKCVLLLRDDGAVLAGYPAAQDGETAMLPAALEGRFVSPTNAAGAPAPTLFVGHRLAGYPLTIVVGRSRASIVARWRLHVGRDMLFGVPAMLLLMAASLAALRRAGREAAALARLRGEMARREAAEAALMRAQRLEVMGQLTSGIAHDFNNLLSILTGQLELIGREPTASPRLRELAHVGLNATGRGAELTSKMLAFSRREAVRPELVDANHVLAEFAPVLRGGAGSAVDLKLEMAPELPLLSLDPGELEAAVLNLVTNARDAMLDGTRGAPSLVAPRVVVSTSVAAAELAGLELASGRIVRVAVSDTGPGMSDAVAARAFEPFFTSKEVGRGTGLGLSQVYGFCRSAGGLARILGRQGAPGAPTGATVEMLLPAASAERASLAPAALARPPAGNPGAGKVVLVAEDEPALREVVAENLTELGYSVIAVADGRAALAELEGGGRIDVLFSDVMMPGGVDGLQLMQSARRWRPGLRIVLTSGAASLLGEMPPEVRMLAKPYRREQLAQCLVG